MLGGWHLVQRKLIGCAASHDQGNSVTSGSRSSLPQGLDQGFGQRAEGTLGQSKIMRAAN